MQDLVNKELQKNFDEVQKRLQNIIISYQECFYSQDIRLVESLMGQLKQLESRVTKLTKEKEHGH